MDIIENRIKAIHDNLSHWMTPEVLTACLGMTDLTSLKATDTCSSITRLVNKVNDFQKRFPGYPLPASICVYPNFAGTVRQTLTVPRSTHDRSRRMLPRIPEFPGGQSPGKPHGRGEWS